MLERHNKEMPLGEAACTQILSEAALHYITSSASSSSALVATEHTPDGCFVFNTACINARKD